MLMKKLAYFLFLVCVLQSCATIYTPQTAAPILLEEKGEVQVDVGGSLSADPVIPSVNGSVSYAINNKLRTQLYANHSQCGITHLQALLGYDFSLTDKSKLLVSGGYFQGFGSIQDTDHGLFAGAVTTTYTGNYQSLFGKMQYSRAWNKGNGHWGIMLTSGYLQPNYQASTERLDYVTTETINQSGLLLEPNLFANWNISERINFSVSYSYAWIKSLDQINTTHPNQYALNYNKYGSLGLNFGYKLGQN